ncbi:hypothetical protein [Acinetobacter nectaris]|uniref:hypothetical protein n=1 Tax=Acinetobacter nectaris TaxID=1219382 RepID=UPI001F250108|nr:hypothetical protein [Acinetobacter nectaris]MCF9047204.1 hypothetical protein [Acinetobacter nectaris]
MKIKHIILSVLALTSTHIFADECKYPNNEPLLIDDGSQRIIQQQARNTWDDWIWRGQSFQCPSTGTQSCQYQWSQAQTTGYSWAVGGTLNLDKIPVIGKYMPASINGSYSHNQSVTTTFGWNITLNPGYSAQPIQVVTRRWMKGVYKGAWVNDGGRCNGESKWAPSIRPDRTSMYNWDPNRIATSWSTNAAIRTYATYHVYK